MTPSIQSALRGARFRRQAVPLQFACADRIDLLDGSRWDRVTAHRGALMRRAYFRELERALPPNLDLRYALLCRDGEPVAALAMQLVEIAAARLHKSEPRSGLRGLVARSVERVADHIAGRVLVVGNLLTYGNHGIAIMPGSEADPGIWHGIGEVAYRVRRAEKHSGSASFVLVKDLTASEMASSRLLHDLGYRAVETEPNMVLALAPGWRNHGDYLAALSNKYRKNIRTRVLEPIAQAGLTVEPISDVAAESKHLQQLYLAVHENATLRPVTLGVDYWQALARGAGERVRFAAVRQQGRMLGFIVTLRDDDDVALGYHIGFDREAATELPLYLRLLHRAIEDSIALGARCVSLGRTALEPKAMLGAKPEPLHVWVRHRHPVLNRALRALLGRIHHDEAPERNPFGGASRAAE